MSARKAHMNDKFGTEVVDSLIEVRYRGWHLFTALTQISYKDLKKVFKYDQKMWNKLKYYIRKIENALDRTPSPDKMYIFIMRNIQYFQKQIWVEVDFKDFMEKFYQRLRKIDHYEDV
jgi:hypothetical protein